MLSAHSAGSPPYAYGVSAQQPRAPSDLRAAAAERWGQQQQQQQSQFGPPSNVFGGAGGGGFVSPVAEQEHRRLLAERAELDAYRASVEAQVGRAFCAPGALLGR